MSASESRTRAKDRADHRETSHDIPMSEIDPRDEIARLEAEIEALAESAERCRKIILFSKAAIAVGGLLILAIVVTRPVNIDPAILIVAIASVIGGIVGLGSNVRTLQQTAAAMQSAEALRAELIDGIGLRTVDAAPRG
jgi:hypothetical protein